MARICGVYVNSSIAKSEIAMYYIITYKCLFVDDLTMENRV